jgi:hypothetical protein
MLALHLEEEAEAEDDEEEEEEQPLEGAAVAAAVVTAEAEDFGAFSLACRSLSDHSGTAAWLELLPWPHTAAKSWCDDSLV